MAMFVSAAKDDEEGKLAKAERAARMAGVSVRTWMARLTLSERTLVVDFIVAVVRVVKCDSFVCRIDRV